MTHLERQIELARKHLQGNRMDDCLEVIDRMVKDDGSVEFRNMANLITSRFTKYKSDEIVGVIAPGDLTLNNIKRSVSEFLQLVEDSLVEKEEVMIQSKEKVRDYRSLINDQFENNRRGWTLHNNISSLVKIEDHRLYMDIRSTNHAFRSQINQPIPEHQDVLIKTKCKVFGFGPYSLLGIFWGASKRSMDTAFSFTYYPGQDCFRFLETYNGRTNKDSGEVKIERLEDPSLIRLELQRINGVTEIYLNKRKVYTCELPSFYGPNMGLVAGANIEVAFEYFQVGVRDRGLI